jgi:hypothetical protein
VPCQLPGVALHLGGRGRGNARVIESKGAFDPAHCKNRSIELHRADSFSRPTRSHLLCTDIPELNRALGGSDSKTIAIFDSATDYEFQVPVLFWEFEQLADIFVGLRVLVVDAISTRKIDDALSRACKRYSNVGIGCRRGWGNSKVDGGFGVADII